MHTCRHRNELDYGRRVIEDLGQDPLIGDAVAGKLFYYPTTTREASAYRGRITETLASGQVFADLGLPGPLDPAVDRAMVCGSLAFNRDVAALLQAHGLREGSNAQPGDFVVEKAFVGEGV
jgi:ferredoxin--NADP+ reductase